MKRILFLALVLFSSFKSSQAQTSTCGTIPFTVTVSQTQQILCNGNCNAVLTAVVNGGVGPFSFLWNPTGTITPTITGVCAGTYVLMVTDGGQGQSCAVTVMVNQPPVLNAITTQMAPTCATACDGFLAGTQSGGTGGYSVMWTNLTTGLPMGSNPSQSNICNGTYQYCVTDANGCTDCDIQVVNAAPCSSCSLVVTTNIQPAICTSSTGTACVGVSGGSGNYSFLWGASAGSQTTSCASNIPSGNHCVTITDLVSGCDTIICMNVGTTTSPMVATAIPTAATCFGFCDGSVVGLASGGTGPYQFSITGGTTWQSSGNFSGLCAGTHILIALDANGCQAIYTFMISQPPQITFTTSTVNPSCAGCCDGSIAITATGGVGSYTYSVNNGVTYVVTNTFAGLCIGAYQVCVQDANGCQVCQTVVLTASGTSCNLSLFTNTQPAVCTSSTGVACVGVTGGSGNYAYLWGASAGSQTTSCATGIPSGNHCVTVTDLTSGCDTVICMNVNATSSNVVATGTSTPVSCNGSCDGTFTAIASGGTGAYTYSVDGSPFQASTVFTGLCPGVHILTAMDANGCQAIFTFMLSNPSAITITYNATPPSCATACDGSIVFNVTGGSTPYTYTMNSASGGASFNNLCNGTYVFCATDANGCTSCVTVVFNTTTSCNPCGFTINTTIQPAMCTSSSGAACVGVTGGSGSYSYLWDVAAGSQTTSCATNLAAGTYCVTITDVINLCDSVVCVTVNQNSSNIVATAMATNATCNGVCDGQVTALASGGTPPYTYSLDNGPYQSNNVFTGVCAGVHIAYAKDAYGCIGLYTIMVTQPSPVVAVTTVVTPPSNTSACDGTLIGTANGGTPGYVYTWSILGGGVVSTQATLTGVCDTTYIFCATDINGCTNCDTIVVNANNSVAEWNSNTFSVYPNPANGEFFIQTSLSIQANVQVLDALGRIKLSTRLNGNSLRVDMSGSDWSSGMYIVKISNSTHNYSVRVVKK